MHFWSRDKGRKKIVISLFWINEKEKQQHMYMRIFARMAMKEIKGFALNQVEP